MEIEKYKLKHFITVNKILDAVYQKWHRANSLYSRDNSVMKSHDSLYKGIMDLLTAAKKYQKGDGRKAGIN